MAYTKTYTNKIMWVGFIILLLVFAFLMVGFSKFCYEKGLQDGLYHNQMILSDSTYRPQEYKLQNY